MELVICGDLSVTDECKSCFARQDARGAFGDTLEIIRDADCALINLECALTESDEKIRKIGPALKAPVATADTIKAAGFTGCLLSNNHIFDYGRKGLDDTLDALARCFLPVTGIGDTEEDARRDLVLTDGNLKVAVVNVCEHEYSYATDNRIGTRSFDPFETMEDIRRAKKDADAVVVVYHGGKEYCEYPSPRLMRACREMVRCGADAVLCQHSHIIGTYEHFEGGHILYGQGNFHFLWPERGDSFHRGLIVRLSVERGKVGIGFVPVIGGEGHIRQANDCERAEILSAFEERNRKIADGSWRAEWSAFCESNASFYRKSVGFSDETTPEEYQLLAHYLDCEAHTDVLRELFPTWNRSLNGILSR